jgi:probable blue pigment (indigoidine) exporter
MSLAFVRRAPIALTLAAASWGLGTVVSKRAVEEIPPLQLLPIQLAASLVALALLMRARGIPLRDPTMPSVLPRLGILNPGLAYALSLLGLVHITASLSVLLWATEPVLILVLAAIVLRERVGPSFIALSAVAVIGMLLVIYQPGTGGDGLGVALTLAGVACCAVYTIIARRWLDDASSTATVVFGQQAYALAFALILAVGLRFATGEGLPSGITLVGWISAVGSGILYYGLAYWFYLSALRDVAASTAATSFYLIPVFGVAGGMLLLGERLTALQWVGAIVVLVAVALILRRPSAVGASGVMGERASVPISPP